MGDKAHNRRGKSPWSGDLSSEYQGNFYGKWAQVQLLDYLRTERRFESREALIAQMKEDVKAARRFFRMPD